MDKNDEKVLPWPDDTVGRDASGEPAGERTVPLDDSYATESPADLLGRLGQTRAVVPEQQTGAGVPEEFDEPPIVRLVNLILVEALRAEATEIHLDPQEDAFRVRYRIDGVLQDRIRIPKHLQPGTLARIKILAQMDISEHRVPQDGRLTVMFDKRRTDLWVSVLPGIHGEKIYVRAVREDGKELDLGQLGFEEDDLERFRTALEPPRGLILAAGPAGSGKSTTLYAALSALSRPGVNVIAIEEVITRKLAGITQVQLAPAIGFSVGSAVRAALRQNPEALLVGGIYDYETAELVCKAAMAGTATFATLPVLDAVSAVVRLLNMGLEPYLVASGLRLVVAQRLCRRLCAECREPADVPTAALVSAGFKPEEAKRVRLYRGRGCARCSNTGYRGRALIHQVLSGTPEFREAVMKHGGWADPLKETAVGQGMRTLREAGRRTVIAGITTLDEVVRVTPRE